MNDTINPENRKFPPPQDRIKVQELGERENDDPIDRRIEKKEINRFDQVTTVWN